MTLDPALHAVLGGGLALLLLHAARHKLSGPGAFRAALAGYALLPRRAVAAAAGALVAAELATGVALLVAFALLLLAPPVGGSVGAFGLPRAAALGAAALFALYTGAIAINLARGRRAIDCGCGGPAARRSLSGGLVARNAALIACAVVASAPGSSRALGWLDFTTIAFGLAASALLYAAFDALLANAPRLRALRGTP